MFDSSSVSPGARRGLGALRGLRGGNGRSWWESAGVLAGVLAGIYIGLGYVALPPLTTLAIIIMYLGGAWWSEQTNARSCHDHPHPNPPSPSSPRENPNSLPDMTGLTQCPGLG